MTDTDKVVTVMDSRIYYAVCKDCNVSEDILDRAGAYLKWLEQ